jgi:hypothetical protein
MTDPTAPGMSDADKAAAWDAHVAAQTAPAAAAAAVPQPYTGPPGAGQLSRPLPPPPPPEPPKTVPIPHPEESFAPGELAQYTYTHPADKPGVKRTQVVMVTHTDDTHIHGFVLAEMKDLASFLKGELTHGHHDPAPAGS